jgi:hypothetical protein
MGSASFHCQRRQETVGRYLSTHRGKYTNNMQTLDSEEDIGIVDRALGQVRDRATYMNGVTGRGPVVSSGDVRNGLLRSNLGRTRK